MCRVSVRKVQYEAVEILNPNGTSWWTSTFLYHLLEVCALLFVPLFQELKGGKAYAKVSVLSSATSVMKNPHPPTARSPEFTEISHIYVDCHVSPLQTDGPHCLQLGSLCHEFYIHCWKVTYSAC